MCGIVGYVGKKKNVTNVLIEGLKALEYRGYDSAGIALWNKENFKLIKSKGKMKELEKKLEEEQMDDATIGIGHTRWATHGEPTDINSHPHRSGSVTLVHNGIIENYHELKEILIEKGYSFLSETDTEVVAVLIRDLLKEEQDKVKVLQKMTTLVRGSYALGIVFDDDIDHIYAIRKDSPLIIGVGDDENFIASDIPAIIRSTKNYMMLEANELAVIGEKNITIYDEQGNKVQKEVKTANWSMEQAEKGGYPHFMMKEMMEEPDVLKKTVHSYIESKQALLEKMPDLAKYDSIHIVACGSAMYAGMIGKTLIETYGNVPVTVEVASEYRYKKNFYTKNTLVILVSQSGETADTIASLRIAKEQGVDTLAIVNVYGSTIARESDQVLYIYAGPEIAVATTKAYLLQVAMLSLIALNLAVTHGVVNDEELDQILSDYRELDHKLEEVLKCQETYFEVAKEIHEHDDVFFIGRGIDYAMSLEGSLKLKEISYIHSEAYQAGELKHGTISLIEKDTPVISIMTDEYLEEKTISNIKEVKARGAKVILITKDSLNREYDFCDHKIVVPNTNFFTQAILTVPVLQMISYDVARRRGCDIDQPRNLAKSVTVE